VGATATGEEDGNGWSPGQRAVGVAREPIPVFHAVRPCLEIRETSFLDCLNLRVDNPKQILHICAFCI
jgi:hypothetical protein